MLLRTQTFSFTGSSDDRIGDSSSSFPTDFGVQRGRSAPIGMKTNPSRFTGAAGVAASAVAAGTIASRSGSDSAAPTPLRNVRRGRARFEMNLAMTRYGERGSNRRH